MFRFNGKICVRYVVVQDFVFLVSFVGVVCVGGFEFGKDLYGGYKRKWGDLKVGSQRVNQN